MKHKCYFGKTNGGESLSASSFVNTNTIAQRNRRDRLFLQDKDGGKRKAEGAEVVKNVGY